jgi:hypothetical protein
MSIFTPPSRWNLCCNYRRPQVDRPEMLSSMNQSKGLLRGREIVHVEHHPYYCLCFLLLCRSHSRASSIMSKRLFVPSGGSPVDWSKYACGSKTYSTLASPCAAGPVTVLWTKFRLDGSDNELKTGYTDVCSRVHSWGWVYCGICGI